MSVRIRTGDVVDAETVLRLWRDADAAASMTDDEAALRGLLERDPAALLIAEDDGEPVGTLIVGGTAGAAPCTGWPCCRRGAAGVSDDSWWTRPSVGCGR
jgi:hypothetical protein